MTNNNASVSPSKSTKVKIIKRYQNRKLYDTQQSCYVTLDDIAKMIRATEEVMVVDNKTKRDITASTLTQIIFEAEKKSGSYAPLYTLRDIIQHEDGSISGYLAKLGAFPASHKTKISDEPAIVESTNTSSKSTASYDDVKSNLNNRINAADNKEATTNSLLDNDDVMPELPSSNNTNFNI